MPPDQLPRISVIIPTFRRFEPLLETIENLLVQDYPSFDVHVMDQNWDWPRESLQRREVVRRDARVQWHVLRTPGVVMARNEGVQNSSGEILVFLDDDVAIRRHDFLRAHAANYADAAIVAVAGQELDRTQAGREIPPTAAGEERRWEAAHPLDAVLGFGRDAGERYDVCTFSTCNGSIRRCDFLAAGGFDESFRGNSYGDDYDLALRLHAAGKKIVFDPRASLVHLRAPLGGLRLSDAANSFSERDKALCCWIFFFRHVRRTHVWNLLYHHVLRKTVLIKRNLTEPWRQPAAWLGLVLAMVQGLGPARRGPTSRFLTRGKGLEAS